MSQDSLGNRSLKGVYYEATVPDTLDLAERARLAIHGMIGNIDTKLMTMYGMITFCARRPHLSHWGSAETQTDPGFAIALPLMRQMSGSDQHADIEAAFRKKIYGRVEGGFYWDRADSGRAWRNDYSKWLYGEGKNEDFVSMIGNAGVMAMRMGQGASGAHPAPPVRPGGGAARASSNAVYQKGAGRRFATNAVDKTVNEMGENMRRILVVKGDYGYYPEKGGWGETAAYPKSGWQDTKEAESETEGGEGSIVAYQAVPLTSAVGWYEQTGSPVALDLATKLANYIMLPKFWGGVADPNSKPKKDRAGQVAARLPDPPFTAAAEMGHWYSHFACRAAALEALLSYGRVTADERVIEFVRRSYEFSLTQGIARIGWINCYPGATCGWSHVEGCGMAALVRLGLSLSDMGVGDYWDDVDAITRNHLAEQQFLRADLLEQVVEQFKSAPDATADAAPGKLCFDDVIQRSIGAFAGLSRPNGIPRPLGLMCCTATCSGALHKVWSGTLRETFDDRATVNLFLNRAGRLLDIDSFLPYEGKLVLRNKQARSIAVRLPSWVDKRALRFDAGRLPTEPYWVGRYLTFENPPAGAAIALTFPIRAQTATYTIDAGTRREERYTCEFRGSTLVDISPRDEAATTYPIYQRSHMRSTAAPLRKVQRFVAG